VEKTPARPRRQDVSRRAGDGVATGLRVSCVSVPRAVLRHTLHPRVLLMALAPPCRWLPQCFSTRLVSCLSGAGRHSASLRSVVLICGSRRSPAGSSSVGCSVEINVRRVAALPARGSALQAAIPGPAPASQ